MDACMRQGFFPKMMDYLKASDDDAIGESMRMVDEAGIYLGILAHRYGYVISIHRNGVQPRRRARHPAAGCW